MKKNILVIAGEPSGDQRAGEMLKELLRINSNLNIWGIGGDLMGSLGVDLIEHIRNLSIVGIWGVLKNLKKIHKQYKSLTKNIEERKPDMAILVDYPGFNLKVAAFLHKKNIPVVYYVIPQVWVWGESRVKLLKKYTDKIIVLFNFEKTFLKKFGIDAEFAGHPLLDKAPELLQRTEKVSTIALLPGSRKNEISNLLPIILDAANKIYSKNKNLNFLLAESSNVDKNIYNLILSKYPRLPITISIDNTFNVLNSSDFAIVTSGTATLETAVMEKPMLITYKASLLTYALFRIIIGFHFLGLVNIMAKKEIVPELMQYNATGERIAEKALEMISDSVILKNTKDELRKIKKELGEKGASKHIAEIISKLI